MGTKAELTHIETGEFALLPTFRSRSQLTSPRLLRHDGTFFSPPFCYIRHCMVFWCLTTWSDTALRTLLGMVTFQEAQPPARKIGMGFCCAFIHTCFLLSRMSPRWVLFSFDTRLPPQVLESVGMRKKAASWVMSSCFGNSFTELALATPGFPSFFFFNRLTLSNISQHNTSLERGHGQKVA